MVLMPINPKKVKVGRVYYLRPKGMCRIIKIYKHGYKVKTITDDEAKNRILPKLRKAEDLMLRRPDYMVCWENPKER